MQVTSTSEVPNQTEQPEAQAPSGRASRKSILALSMLALAINGTAAIYTLPSSFEIPLPNVSLSLPDINRLAELLPHEKASAPKPDPVLVALTDIQSTQQQHAASLQEALQANNSSLQQNTVLLQRDTTALLGLRQSLTDEQSDIKKISTQLSTLMAKVDTLQNAIAPEITSSIPKGRAHNRLSAMARKKWVRLPKPVGPVSVGGAPLTTAPAQGFGAEQSPEG
ncbi:hypothetical protein [Bradyrhizobium sp.]|uniref:hypothetical protein n=1 Tax=Bradyrhizobium sp. TaxID=376 RepID=UPI002628830A|nr:hypothetical protein [Bradyrhizobium sp.]